MKSFLLTPMLSGAHLAYACEYQLQFTPQGDALGLMVAGYEFNTNTVVGDCSYYTVSAGSGAALTGRQHTITTSALGTTGI